MGSVGIPLGCHWGNTQANLLPSLEPNHHHTKGYKNSVVITINYKPQELPKDSQRVPQELPKTSLGTLIYTVKRYKTDTVGFLHGFCEVHHGHLEFFMSLFVNI